MMTTILSRHQNILTWREQSIPLNLLRPLKSWAICRRRSRSKAAMSTMRSDPIQEFTRHSVVLVRGRQQKRHTTGASGAEVNTIHVCVISEVVSRDLAKVEIVGSNPT